MHGLNLAESFASQHTQSFPDFLAQMGVSVLVTTYQAGKLIHLRHQDGVLNTHFLDMQKPMGMALRGARLAIGTAYHVWDYYNMADVAPKVAPFNTHDACYLPRELHITGDIDIHEMAFSDDNELWLVNTKMSCLCTLAPEYSVVPRWCPPFISEYDLTDRCHLNGLAMRDGKPAYVSALGTTNSAAGWRENKAAGGMLMELDTNRMLASGLAMPHSPRWYQGQLWVLESGAGSLATVDLVTGKLTTVVELPGFTRGIDFIGRYAVIGLSQVRETAVFAGLPLTKRCEARECGIYIVDIVEKQVIAFVVFSGDVQEIFAVQIVPAKNPVVLSLDNPLLRTSYSLPDEALDKVSEPDPQQTRLQRANQLLQTGETDEAISAYLSLLKDFPENGATIFHLGLAYLEQRNWQEAVDILTKVIAKEQKNADALNALGQAWEGLKAWDKALAHYDSALSVDQQFATAHVNRGMLLLRLGRLKEGWQGLEWRWKIPGMSALNCIQPQWKGEDISNKTVLVHTEQTDSDIILFARFLSLLAKHCQRTIVLCDEPFRLFFKSIQGVDEVRVQLAGVQEDSFDVYTPLMSLPACLGTLDEEVDSDDGIALPQPFLHTLPEVVVPVLETDKPCKIGLIWREGDSRAIFEEVIALVKEQSNQDIQFYSLQIDINLKETESLENNHIIRLDADMFSYAHAAALIAQLDGVISVDSPLVHLAGSLGVNTLLVDDTYLAWYWDARGKIGRNMWYPRTTIIDLSEFNELALKKLVRMP